MHAADPTNNAVAVTAINDLGLELLRTGSKSNSNALLSPYSIQNALAMTWSGADGNTFAEMKKALHYSADNAEIGRSFAALRQQLDDAAQRSALYAGQAKNTNNAITLTIANGLFGQTGYNFHESFLSQVKEVYSATFDPLDFAKNPAGATKHINTWVEERTRQRIRNLIPDDALDRLTRLVLVNAIYLKAPWQEPFSLSATHPQPFHLSAVDSVSVPTMAGKRNLGYAKRAGFSVVTIPYLGGDIQFLILLPDEPDGLAALEKKLTVQLLVESANLPRQEVILYLPQLKLEPPLMILSAALQSLGMRTAFDKPQGSANFNRIAPRRADDYLYISDVFHKTFLRLDENGTEAAAATAIAMRAGAIKREPQQPAEVRVDHPFLFAIQHRPTGACLFLGRLTDPR